MRIYRVRPHISVYQSLSLVGRPGVEAVTFDGARRNNWTPLETYVLYPKLEVPDFWFMPIPSAFGVTQQLSRKLERILLNAGELLAVRKEGEEIALLNVTRCVSALDKEKSEWATSVIPKKYGFHRERIPSSLLKIPETSVAEILCAEWEGNPDKEFKAAVEHYGLKGVRFQLLWEG